MGTGTAGVLTSVTGLSARGTARERAAALESRFGDPADPDNPLGHEAFLRADARAELPAEGERLLERFGLNAEFVPRSLGGRLDSIEGLVQALRPVFRRDASLGIGYGVSSFMAAVNAWFAGTQEQRRFTADLLLGGGRMTVAYQEIAHGNDFVRNEFHARRGGSGFLLDGDKHVINNVERAEALMLYARTDKAKGSRSHSVLLVDKELAPAGHTVYLPRRITNGCRGLQFGGVQYAGLPVPASAVVGGVGQGVELSLRSFKVTRSALPSMVLALVDTCLRTAVGFAGRQSRDTGTGMDTRSSRSVLAAAFADILLCDSLALAATRSASLLPRQSSGVYAAAVKYLLPKILTETVYDLSIILGSALYDKDGPYGIFQKHVRDLPVITLGHAGTAACQATIIPQMPLLARAAWFQGAPAPGELFEADGRLPPLNLEQLRPHAGHDPVAASLVAAVEDDPERGDDGEDVIHRLAQGFLAELRSLRDLCLELRTTDPAWLAGPETSALADRYVHVLAAASVVGVWRQERRVRPGGFLADPAWAVTALSRTAGRLGGLPGLTELPEPPAHFEDLMVSEVLSRFGEPRSYDLYNSPLSG
ncbi:acyl-CoA dehydrogenase family protein [Wenjunlia tyrosinilytica]|nr:acyl-CoA dehydrogenase family protein [Wenjunlia tyrosinilytica]